MADRISEQHRSWNMSQIKCSNTIPEIKVRSVLHRMGYRFRLHRRDLPGKPDIVLPKFHLIIFVHGCFWHRHPGCKYAYTPKSRNDFWMKKFRQNTERDQLTRTILEALDWKVRVIWECETGDDVFLAEKIRKLFCEI